MTSLATRLHGRTAAGVPRWAVWAAYAATLTTLPSCVWRLAAVNINAPMMEHTGNGPAAFSGGWWYVIGLCVVSETLAFLAVGLVAQWGEVWPRWIPGLRGRRVPVLAAVIPAGLGSLALWIFPYALTMFAFGMKINGEPGALILHGWQVAAFWVAYLPLAAWGPLLGVLTVHYYRRRTTIPGGRESAVAGGRESAVAG
ncbi:hypothetical protein J4573_46025 [Actinomadura barringtoniae]|uniref:Uncharacterized protein n=1 Tax=Actinomadura barringtoniae TaxID=1427535 RepID=A0A939PQW2_9ACTN|nr:hypothetical protein [Actinomadura barringtoniae]MBO2454514.1 hypothetical protein [Actinomadura barringtoniae]